MRKSIPECRQNLHKSTERKIGPTHKSIFLNQVGNHVPLTAVTHWATHQGLYQSAIQLLRSGIDNVLQEPICFLNLIPVKRECLTELKARQIVLLHYGHAENIC